MKKTKIKIEIKHWITGSILFEYEKEDNTLLTTVKEAVNRSADLTGADLTGADLRGADLRGAYLRGAYLTGAENKDKIKMAIVFTGIYKYVVIPYITEENEKRVKMGCCDRALKEWEEDFWNNPGEFPNNGDLDSKLRMLAFQTAKQWFGLVEEKK